MITETGIVTSDGGTIAIWTYSYTHAFVFEI